MPTALVLILAAIVIACHERGDFTVIAHDALDPRRKPSSDEMSG
jgi:hypothetical protein